MNKIKAFVFLIVIAFLLFYFALPVINYGFLGLPIILLVLTLLGIFIFTRFKVVNEKKIQLVEKPSKIFFIIIGLLLFYIVVFPLFTSLPMFRTQAYKNLLGKVGDGTSISNHIAPISIDEIRVVDQDLAYLLGEKILGSQPALGSQVELGNFCIQKVGKDLYWVAPLLHSGFFKWMNNQEGTAGYVMVSATNERDVKLVQNVGGKDIKIKYQSEAYFGSEIARHLYMNGYATVGLTDYTFEIDDAGNPFWVVTKYDKKLDLLEMMPLELLSLMLKLEL